MFGNLKNDGLEKQEDRLGGGFTPFSTNVYAAKIKMMYGMESSGGAMGVELLLDIGGKEYNETIYVTSGKEKGQKNYFEKDGKKYPMPGFTTVNDLALVVTGKELNQLDFEDRIVEAWDRDAGKKVNKTVQAATDLIGAEILVAIQEVIENKQKRNDATGNYEDVPGETRTSNNIAKVFTADKRTVREVLDEVAEGEGKFHDDWLKKNEGVAYDKTKKGGANNGTAGGPPKAGATQAPAKEGKALFGKK